MNENSKLKHLLRTWDTPIALRENFNRSVWLRIDQEETVLNRTLARFLERVIWQIQRPAVAAALLIVSTALSALAADLRAHHMRDVYRLDQARRYLASIDPLAMTGEQARTDK